MAGTVRTTAPAVDDARWAAARQRLEAQRADCVEQRAAALAETAQSMPDEVAVTRAATLQRTIEDIDAALARIAAGSYGRCGQCGGDIPEERLELRPFATTCVACASRR